MVKMGLSCINEKGGTQKETVFCVLVLIPRREALKHDGFILMKQGCTKVLHFFHVPSTVFHLLYVKLPYTFFVQ